MVTFGLLGLWQLNVARDDGRAEQVRLAPTREVVEIASLLTPHGAFPPDGTGRRVTASGRYDGTAQVLVTPRRLEGRPGYWVVTPLIVQPSGARVAVVRGFVTDPRQAVAPDRAAEVRVSGTLAPGESPGDSRSGQRLPAGQLAALDLSLLVNRWPGALYNGFIFASAEQPDVTSATSEAMQRVPPPPLVGGGLSWRNAAYALQWWVFALFAGYMWWRMVRDDYQDSRADLDDQEPGDHSGHDLAPFDEAGKATNV